MLFPLLVRWTVTLVAGCSALPCNSATLMHIILALKILMQRNSPLCPLAETAVDRGEPQC